MSAGLAVAASRRPLRLVAAVDHDTLLIRHAGDRGKGVAPIGELCYELNSDEKCAAEGSRSPKSQFRDAGHLYECGSIPGQGVSRGCIPHMNLRYCCWSRCFVSARRSASVTALEMQLNKVPVRLDCEKGS